MEHGIYKSLTWFRASFFIWHICRYD